jgi:anti-sigma factor RsiW
MLLDDYLDRELPTESSTTVDAHLEVCPDCRIEYERTLRLKELLASGIVPEPAEPYWDEVTDLILARTVEKDGITELERHRGRPQREKNSFYRSLVSVAASLALFFTALWLGPSLTRDAGGAIWTERNAAPQTVEIAGRNNAESLLSRSEQDRIAGGLLLVGSPGMFAGPVDLPAVLGLGGGR